MVTCSFEQKVKINLIDPKIPICVISALNKSVSSKSKLVTPPPESAWHNIHPHGKISPSRICMARKLPSQIGRVNCVLFRFGRAQCMAYSKLRACRFGRVNCVMYRFRERIAQRTDLEKRIVWYTHS